MSKLSDRHYKEKQPEETVGQIQKILKNLEINVTEKWQKKSSIGTYALRLKIENMDIGVNGKGINKIYAQASAYAELIERLQNDLLGDLNVTALPSKYPFQMIPLRCALFSCPKQIEFRQSCRHEAHSPSMLYPWKMETLQPL